MQCDKCGSLNVVTKIVIQSDKGTEELNLCASCFRSFVKDHPGITEGPAGKSVSDFLLGALNQINGGLRSLGESEGVKQSDTRICPECSSPVLMIKKEQRTGCPKCYLYFRDEIDRFLYRETGMHFPEKHPVKKSRKEIRESYRTRISEAVRSENYEIAAMLRDELKKLK